MKKIGFFLSILLFCTESGWGANRWRGFLRVWKTRPKQPSTPLEVISPRAAEDALKTVVQRDRREAVENLLVGSEYKEVLEIRMSLEMLHDPVWLLTHSLMLRGAGSCSLLAAVVYLEDRPARDNKLEALLKYADVQLRVYCSCAPDPEASLQTDVEMFKKFVRLPCSYTSNYRYATLLKLATQHKLKHVLTLLIQQIDTQLSSAARERVEGYVEALKYLGEGEPVVFPLKPGVGSPSPTSLSSTAVGWEEADLERNEGCAEYKNVPGCIDDEA